MEMVRVGRRNRCRIDLISLVFGAAASYGAFHGDDGARHFVPGYRMLLRAWCVWLK